MGLAGWGCGVRTDRFGDKVPLRVQRAEACVGGCSVALEELSYKKVELWAALAGMCHPHLSEPTLSPGMGQAKAEAVGTQSRLFSGQAQACSLLPAGPPGA